MKKNKTLILAVICLALPGLLVQAQASPSYDGSSPAQTSPAGMRSSTGTELPLKRLSLFSSGLAYFEHSGTIAGQAEISLPFDAAAVNDVLKSLVVNDPASDSPSVRYASQNTLERTLNSLKIDLTGAPGIGDILNGLKGAELEVHAPNPIRGRIIGVEYRQAAVQQYGFPQSKNTDEAWLSLFTAQGIRVIEIKDISSFRFTDEGINADLNRALDLIMASRDENTRNLVLNLNGTGSRTVSLSYVIPVPVWKVSYRLDLSGLDQSGAAPFLQGWAIVDNDSDTDWKGVELSLVIGRPVSFIQNLYPPYRVSRPVLPLAIAGIAEGRAHESGYIPQYYGGPGVEAQASRAYPEAMADQMNLARERTAESYLSAPVPSVAGGYGGNTAAGAAGDQFLFTLSNPVTLDRRQSAMLPLVEGSVRAEKTLVFSGARAASGAAIHPEISAELTNTSGMRLPAGPITVYDGGTYAGDALIEFFPENEKRLISYGEDLSVSGNMSYSSSRNVTAVNVSGGIMTITRRQNYERLYTIRNASDEAKKLIIEHPLTPGSTLAEPARADEQTSALYRFVRNLSAKETLSFRVREETPVAERITLATLRPETFLSYATNQEIPANVRAALNRAIELKRTADNAAAAQAQFETQRSRLVSEQNRIRQNLEAAGTTSPQGQEYLRRLGALDTDIDGVNRQIDAAIKETERAKKEYDDYLAALSI